MRPQEGWLKCEISEGMLPEEYAIQCSSFDGSVFSFFAPQTEDIDPKQNLVRVSIMEYRSDSCLIYVPFVPLEGGVSRTVKVRSKDVDVIGD